MLEELQCVHFPLPFLLRLRLISTVVACRSARRQEEEGVDVDVVVVDVRVEREGGQGEGEEVVKKKKRRVCRGRSLGIPGFALVRSLVVLPLSTVA